MKKHSLHPTQLIMKAIRIISIPPVLALLSLLLIYALRSAYFGSISVLLLGILFLCVLPSAGYILQPLIPAFKDKGREGQRQLAIIFSVIGYLSANLYALIAPVPTPIRWIFLTYLLSGIAMLFFNKVLHIRASGHACGIAGPIMSITYAFGPLALLGILLLVVVYYASIKTKSHTLKELLIGSSLSTVALLLSAFFFRLPLWFAI